MADYVLEDAASVVGPRSRLPCGHWGTWHANDSRYGIECKQCKKLSPHYCRAAGGVEGVIHPACVACGYRLYIDITGRERFTGYLDDPEARDWWLAEYLATGIPYAKEQAATLAARMPRENDAPAVPAVPAAHWLVDHERLWLMALPMLAGAAICLAGLIVTGSPLFLAAAVTLWIPGSVLTTRSLRRGSSR